MDLDPTASYSDSSSSDYYDYDASSFTESSFAESVASYHDDDEPSPLLDMDLDLDLDLDLDSASSRGVDAAADMLDLERQLEASIFQVEPVTHITYQLLYVDGSRALERVERHVMQLRVPNVIDRFDIARIIKAARYDRTASSARQLYRLDALFVYNVDVAFAELRSLLTSPAFPVARFITVLSSLSNFTLRPTMACFHSANSIHVVLARTLHPAVDPVGVVGPALTPVASVASSSSTELKRRIVITPAASTRRKRPTADRTKCHQY